MNKSILKVLLIISGILIQINTQAQVERNGRWEDEKLTFLVLSENIKRLGTINLCIGNLENEQCIGNLMTAFELRVFDAQNNEIWNSLWTGTNMNIKLKNKLPNASYLIIKARAPYVVNTLTTTRIYQSKPIEIKYTLR